MDKKLLRAEKINKLIRIYVHVQIRDIPFFNEIIINQVGVSGLKKVKREAWRYPRDKKIFGI